MRKQFQRRGNVARLIMVGFYVNVRIPLWKSCFITRNEMSSSHAQTHRRARRGEFRAGSGRRTQFHHSCNSQLPLLRPSSVPTPIRLHACLSPLGLLAHVHPSAQMAIWPFPCLGSHAWHVSGPSGFYTPIRC